MAQKDELDREQPYLRRATDREPFIVGGDGSPSSATAIRNIALAFFKAGYDGRDTDDMHQLASDLRSYRDRMQKEKERQSSVKAWRIVVISSIITGIVGIAVQWLGPLLHFLFGFHIPQGGA